MTKATLDEIEDLLRTAKANAQQDPDHNSAFAVLGLIQVIKILLRDIKIDD